ncbi:MAG: co-chaperone GroES [bacterium]|nr:co-chaperone GroES [bacterium]
MDLNTDEIEPLGAMVLVRIFHERKTAGGLIVPETAKMYGKNVAEVLAVGPGDMLFDAGTGSNHFRQAKVDVGDFVLIRYHAEQTEVRIAGDDEDDWHVALIDPSVMLARLSNWEPGQVAA